MAVYGVNTSTGVANNGAIPFTGWSPTLGTGAANTGTSSGAVWYNGMTQNDYFIMSNVTRMSNRGFLSLLKALTGAAVGGAASAQYKRVQAVQGGQFSGNILIETVTPVNRSTTAADATAINALWNRVVNPVPYPVDLSGNGGGSKLAFIGVA